MAELAREKVQRAVLQTRKQETEIAANEPPPQTEASVGQANDLSDMAAEVNGSRHTSNTSRALRSCGLILSCTVFRPGVVRACARSGCTSAQGWPRRSCRCNRACAAWSTRFRRSATRATPSCSGRRPWRWRCAITHGLPRSAPLRPTIARRCMSSRRTSSLRSSTRKRPSSTSYRRPSLGACARAEPAWALMRRCRGGRGRRPSFRGWPAVAPATAAADDVANTAAASAATAGATVAWLPLPRPPPLRACCATCGTPRVGTPRPGRRLARRS
jgi:hypothetical protein